MVSGSSDCCAFVWDLGWSAAPLYPHLMSKKEPSKTPYEGWRATPRVIKALVNHTGGVLDVRISEKWIVTCSKDASLVVYNRATLTPHLRLRGHDGPVNSLGLRGDRVVSASGDMKMILWDISREHKPEEQGPCMSSSGSVPTKLSRKRVVFQGHEKGLACVEWKDDDTILSGSNDCTIKIWCATTGTCVRTLTGHNALVRALSFDPYSGILVSASYDQTVRVWDLRDETPIPADGNVCVREHVGYHRSHIFGVGSDCSKILSSSHDHRVVLLDYSDGLQAGMFA